MIISLILLVLLAYWITNWLDIEDDNLLNPAGLAGLLNNCLDIEDDNLLNPAGVAGLLNTCLDIEDDNLLNPAGLAGLLNTCLDIEDDNLLRHEEVEIALNKKRYNLQLKRQWRLTLAAGLDGTARISSDPDSEVQLLTRMVALNSVNITEGIEMVKKVLQMMAVLGEDEASHMLTRGYHKCLDLKTEKRNLNTEQIGLRDFFVSDLDTSCGTDHM